MNYKSVLVCALPQIGVYLPNDNPSFPFEVISPV